MKKLIGIVLILIGISVAGFSFYAKWDTNRENNKAIEQFENKLSSNDSKEVGKDKDTKDDKKIDLMKDGIGILMIPKIDLKVIIKEGTDMKTMKHAVGHFKDSPMPWEKGNFAIAGHRQYTYGEFFNRVDEIGEGDNIQVKTQKGIFNYKITDKKVIEPTKVDVVENVDGDCMTIITCVKGGKKRIAIRAIRL